MPIRREDYPLAVPGAIPELILVVVAVAVAGDLSTLIVIDDRAEHFAWRIVAVLVAEVVVVRHHCTSKKTTDIHLVPSSRDYRWENSYLMW